MGPTSLAAECCAHVQAGKQNILNLLVKLESHMFVTRTGVSQQREAALPLERAMLDKNTPWYDVTVGAETHWPVFGAMSTSGCGHEKQKEVCRDCLAGCLMSWSRGLFISHGHISQGEVRAHHFLPSCSPGWL